MKILLISQFYSPEPRKLFAELAITLQSFGHEVTVLTGFPNWPGGKIYKGYRIRLWQKEVIDGVRVLRVPMFPDHSRSGVRRVLNHLSFAFSAAFLTPFLSRRPDVIHSIQAIPAGLPAVFLGTIWRVPITVEVQDLWPETLEATGFVANQTLLRAALRVVDWIHRRHAKVRVISEGFFKNLRKRGIPAEKLEVISNWVDVDFYGGASSQPAEEAKATPGAKPRRLNIVFAGALGASQGLDTVIEAAELLRDENKVEFTIAGDGTDRAWLEREVVDRKLDNVRFTGWLPVDAMPRLLGAADVLLVQLQDNPLSRITIPHKIFTCLAAGRPVLAAIAGDTAAIVERAGAGITCQPGDAASLADAARRFAAMEPAEREAFGSRGRAAACTHYARVPCVRQIESMLLDACHASPRALKSERLPVQNFD